MFCRLSSASCGAEVHFWSLAFPASLYLAPALQRSFGFARTGAQIESSTSSKLAVSSCTMQGALPACFRHVNICVCDGRRPPEFIIGDLDSLREDVRVHYAAQERHAVSRIHRNTDMPRRMPRESFAERAKAPPGVRARALARRTAAAQQVGRRHKLF
jgi:hypothetical protein